MGDTSIDGWRPSRRRFLQGASALALGVAAGPGPLTLNAFDDDRPLNKPGSLPFPHRPAGQPQPDMAPELAPIGHGVGCILYLHTILSTLDMLPLLCHTRPRYN